MLEYISQYAPNCLYRDITERAMSLTAVWLLIRDWAGLKSTGCKQLAYWQLKRSYDPNGDLSPTDFFFLLRNSMQDCLLRSATNGGTIPFKGAVPTSNETLSATLESNMVADWLEAVGGPALQNHIARVFSKDLERVTLADLRQRISNNLDNLLIESTKSVNGSSVQVYWTKNYSPVQDGTSRRGPAPQTRQPRYPAPRTPRPNSYRPPTPRTTAPTFRNFTPAPSTQCKLCAIKNPQAARTHSLANCRFLDPQDRRQIVRAALVFPDEDPMEDELLHPGSTYEETAGPLPELPEEDQDQIFNDVTYDAPNKLGYQYFTAQSRAVIAGSCSVNIYESPILACTYNQTTVYIVLDSGTTCSLISLSKAHQLGLAVAKTSHRAVQVDGLSPLSVVGEVHIQLHRGSTTLSFSGLVIAEMATDII